MKKLLVFGLVLFVLVASPLVATGDKEAKPQTPASSVSMNPTGFPIVNEPVQFRVFGVRDQNQADWKNVKMLSDYRVRTNVDMIYRSTHTRI